MASELQYDSLGFLIGSIRPKVDRIDQNIADILKTLRKDVRREVEQYQASRLQIDLIYAKNAKSIEHSISKLNQAAIDTSLKQAGTINEIAVNPIGPKSRRGVASKAKVFGEKPNRQMDTDRVSSTESEHTGPLAGGPAKVISKFGEYVGDFAHTAKGMVADSRGIDPTVDALHELGSVFTPVKNVAAAALKPLSTFAKLKRRNEPLEKEESEHNQKQIKALTRISGNMTKGGGFFKSLLKKLSVVGLGAFGLMAASEANADSTEVLESQDLESKQPQVKPPHTDSEHVKTNQAAHQPSDKQKENGFSQSDLNNKMGSSVSPYVKNYTAGLKKADIPKRMASPWDDFINKGKDKIHSALVFLGFADAEQPPKPSNNPGTRSNTAILGNIGSKKDNNGLRLKSGEATAGGNSHKGTTALAQRMQSTLGNKLYHFSAINDEYHQKNKPNSKHTKGLAFDMTLSGSDGKATNQEGAGMAPSVIASIQSKMAAAGLSEKDYYVQNEYSRLSKGATGGHIHFQFTSQKAADKYYKSIESQKKATQATKSDVEQKDESNKISPIAASKADFAKSDRKINETNEISLKNLSPDIEPAKTPSNNNDPRKITVLNQQNNIENEAGSRSLVHAQNGTLSA